MSGDFAAYSSIPNKAALASRSRLPSEILRELDEIDFQICSDPYQKQNPERLRSIGHKRFIYSHPAPWVEITYVVKEPSKRLVFLHYVAPHWPLRPPSLVFISYAHEDTAHLQVGRRFLDELEREGVARFWYDREILAGQGWQEKLTDMLGSAEAGLLLLSPHFFASAFISDNEMPSIRQRHAQGALKIFWVHTSDCAPFEHDLFKRVQSPMRDPDVPLARLKGRPLEEAWRHIAREVRRALRPMPIYGTVQSPAPSVADSPRAWPVRFPSIERVAGALLVFTSGAAVALGALAALKFVLR